MVPKIGKKVPFCHIFRKPEMHKTLQILLLLKAKQQKHCKLQHFWQVDRKKCWYLDSFWNVKKTWKARNTVNSGVLATFGRWNAGNLRSFLPVTVPNPCKLQYFLHFLNNFFALMNAKHAGIYAFSKNRKSWRERNPVNNSVLSTFGDKNCGIYAGSCHLTGQNAVVWPERKLEGGDEKIANKKIWWWMLLVRSFYTDAFTHRSFYAQKLLHREVFIQTGLCTQKLLHREKSLHRGAFSHGNFYTEKSLH